jgi:phage tail sheath protein FI
MAVYNHRISTEEVDTQLTVPVNGTAGLQVVFGTAPVNLAEDPMAVTNVPVIAYTFAEAVKQLGYSADYEKYTLCQAMDASFRVFAVAPVIFVNVLDPRTHKKTYSSGEDPLNVVSGTVKVTETGILQASVEVTSGEDVLVRDTDYTLTFDDDGYLDITVLKAGVTAVKVTADELDPSLVTAQTIVGGVNVNTGEEKGLEVIRQIYPKLGLVPGLILAPGWSHNVSVAAVMRSKCEELNGLFTCECVIDMDSSSAGATVYTALKVLKENMAISDEHCILCWPKLRLGEVTYYYSAIWAAMTATTDAAHGDVPYKSPSNELVNVSAAVLADGTEVVLDNNQAALVNSFGIVTAINDNGWKSWGNNTSIYPTSTDPKDRWIACRRMMSWYRNHFILTYKNKVDDPASYRLIEAVVDSENLYLNSLAANGSIAGGEIRFNEEDNPITNILNGEIKFQTKIAFWTPAEYIHNTIEFDPTILEAALGGE